MVLKIAVQMDDISKFYAQWDNTLCLIEEAQSRGHEVFCYLPESLSLRDGKLSAYGYWIVLGDLKSKDFYTKSDGMNVTLDGFDVLLMRQDPPFDMHYITATHLLEHVSDRVLVLNNPRSVRDNPEKILVTHFPHLMPETVVTGDIDAARSFFAEFRDVVIKPLYQASGKGILRCQTSLEDFTLQFQKQRNLFSAPLMLQKFLPEVRNGDKRVVLLDGEVAGVFLRGVREGNFWTVGQEFAFESPSILTEREKAICAELSPVLRQKDLFFAGLDLIGEKLTEINVTSPAGLRELDHFYQSKPQAKFWDLAEKRLKV